jgi:hypothetical protein
MERISISILLVAICARIAVQPCHAFHHSSPQIQTQTQALSRITSRTKKATPLIVTTIPDASRHRLLSSLHNNVNANLEVDVNGGINDDEEMIVEEYSVLPELILSKPKGANTDTNANTNMDKNEIVSNRTSNSSNSSNNSNSSIKMKTETKSETSMKIPKYKKLSDVINEQQHKQKLKENQEKEHKEIMKMQRDMQKQIQILKNSNTAAASSSSSDSNSNSNSDQEKKPWCAGYTSSRATQKKMNAAAEGKGINGIGNDNDNGSSNPNAIDRAIHVLKTLLNTPPEWCNETNIVCALTLSAKVLASQSKSSSTSSSSSSLSSSPSPSKKKEFRQLLHQTLDILHEIVKKNQLNTRQLANSSWAIAKHYSMDNSILPAQIQKQISQKQYNGQSFISLREEWNLNEVEVQQNIDDNSSNSNANNNKDKDEDCSKQRVLETLDEIAQSLINSIREQVYTQRQGRRADIMNKDQKGTVKIAEISMICWAYSTIYPRQCPAGWKYPSLMGRMNDNSNSSINNKMNARKNKTRGSSVLKEIESNNDYNNDYDNDTVLFERREQDIGTRRMSQFQEEEEVKEPSSLVDKLFDVIAQRLVLRQNGSLTMVEQLKWKELSTVAWAYAHRGFCSSYASVTLISQLADVAINRLENLGLEDEGSVFESIPIARDISETAWALGILQTDNFVFSDALEEFIDVIASTCVTMDQSRPLKEWTSADCVQLAVAMAHGRLDDIGLLKNIYDEAVHSLKEELKFSSSMSASSNKSFQSWELSVLLWVQARLFLTKELGQVFDEYAELLPRVLLLRMKNVNNGSNIDDIKSLKKLFRSIGLKSQEKANLCWSLTVLEKVDSPEAKQLVQAIFKKTALSCSNGEQIKLEHAHQLWQSIFLLGFPSDEVVTDEFLSFLRDSWDQEKARRKSSSARHQALSETLDFMGVSHYNEHDEDIDVAIVLKSESKWLNAASKCDLPDYETKVAVE